MRLITLLSICCLLCLSAKAQPNCDAYRYMGDTLKYEACKVAEGRAGYYQFSYPYQLALDKALAIDTSFEDAYRA